MAAIGLHGHPHIYTQPPLTGDTVLMTVLFSHSFVTNYFLVYFKSPCLCSNIMACTLHCSSAKIVLKFKLHVARREKTGACQKEYGGRMGLRIP